jgi:hypothetical protein
MGGSGGVVFGSWRILIPILILILVVILILILILVLLVPIVILILIVIAIVILIISISVVVRAVFVVVSRFGVSCQCFGRGFFVSTLVDGIDCCNVFSIFFFVVGGPPPHLHGNSWGYSFVAFFSFFLRRSHCWTVASFSFSDF